MEYLLVINGRLDGLNDYISAERSNRYKGAQMKHKNEDLIKKFIATQLRGVHIDKPVYMIYRWYEKNARRDKDNVAFAKKFIQDALVQTDVLENDGWQNIVGFTDYFFIDKGNPRIEVTIKEIEHYEI